MGVVRDLRDVPSGVGRIRHPRRLPPVTDHAGVAGAATNRIDAAEFVACDRTPPPNAPLSEIPAVIDATPTRGVKVIRYQRFQTTANSLMAERRM